MTDHSDPTPDEDDVLAVSALLDGTASAEETARVESDPVLSALLADLRGLRAELADVPAAPAETRDAAVASALAVFDEVHAATALATSPDAATVTAIGADVLGTADVDRVVATPAPAPTNVVRFERRRRWYGVMTGAAAAAVAVLFVGALVVGGLGGGDDEESATVPAETKIDARTAAEGTVAGAPTAGAPEAATEMAADDAGVFDSSGGSDTEAASEATEAPAATLAATETTAAAAGGLGEINAAADVVAINTPEQLRDYARSQQAVLPLPGLPLPCVDDGMEAIGEVTYQGVLAIVVRDPETGTLTGYDTQDACAVVVTVEP